MPYTVFESTNMKSTRYAERIMDAVCTTDVENGTFGYIESLAEGEDVTYVFNKGIKDGTSVVVVDQPAWDYDTTLTSNQRKDKFIVKAGTRFRVRVVALNDEFAISEDGVTTGSKGNLDTGAFLTIDGTTGKLVAKSATTGEATFEAVVQRKRTMGALITTEANKYGYTRVMYEAKINTLA